MKLKSTTIFSSVNKPLNNKRGRTKNTLSNITLDSEIILLKIKTVFPFTLFPDTIIIDLNKLDIIKQDFFLTKRVNSIIHEDILNITVESGPILATLRITSRFFSGKPILITYLKKSEALQAKRLISGLIIARRKGVTLRGIEIEELLNKLEQLGKAE
ncbi:hypothetical protein CO165_03865 [Candidatus Roizmanbacteria bacterium CG_4_9_14_3_um_filter_33_18]|uniref:Uncharacterized protein n=2 Tax=Candidatus Roizmaniibacteriota TaxID=1752723 RepID=A0A2M7XXC7_9BACT|nr:MAG: hypothetical protein COW97_01170 [Candidatus Roizmanbacteria bacterium CG22_combo_CG10-13_8_21_14_all_34_12]PJA55378.1 MAG: hypothetical protein CO165_03865 [Candidatus Roizmanbacteria bacterium CG_4_9_14_3_um_filter_33_18]